MRKCSVKTCVNHKYNCINATKTNPSHPIASPVDMRSMFRVCATERLFVPDMFPSLDAAVYIDTDLLFLRPPEDLWNEFLRFDRRQVAAMAPCLYHYGTKSKVRRGVF